MDQPSKQVYTVLNFSLQPLDECQTLGDRCPIFCCKLLKFDFHKPYNRIAVFVATYISTYICMNDCDYFTYALFLSVFLHRGFSKPPSWNMTEKTKM